VVVLHCEKPQRQAGSYFIYSYNHTDAGGYALCGPHIGAGALRI